MVTTQKPLWLEGMFIQPQHFQQSDRYVEELIATRSRTLRPYAFGVVSLAIDTAALGLGKVALRECRAIMPDGGAVDIPGGGPGPAALSVPAGTQGVRVCLALARRRGDGREVAVADEMRFASRYRRGEQEIVDTTSDGGAAVAIATAMLNVALVLGDDGADDAVLLPIARIKEVAADGAVVLDDSFIPPLLDAHASAVFLGLVDEMSGLLKARAEVLAQRAEAPGAGVASVSDFLLLQAVNRSDALLRHLRHVPGLHPEVLYRAIVQLVGEIATFTQSRRAPDLPRYLHDDLATTFGLALARAREQLSTVSEEPATRLPLQERRYGVYVTPIADRTLIGSARFVLSVAADVPPEVLRTRFPKQAKVGPVEDIRELVTVQLPGIGLTPMPVAPRQVPYHAGSVYFELDKSAELWSKMHASAAFGWHVSGDYPGLRLEFWAVRT